MRILHTSDWHLGRTLEGRSRQAEQEQFIDELCRIAEEENIQLILVAGDVFDTYSPPAYAEELYCHALERLAQGRKRAVVVIAGNHDSPERLSAVRPLALRHGAFIAGRPGETIVDNFVDDGVKLIHSGPGWFELALPSVAYSTIVSMLPYPSESRLQQIFSQELNEVKIRGAYSKTVNDILLRQSSAYRPNSVNIAMSHLFVMGGMSSESERPIEIGGACTVDVNHLPAQAQYTALGHLHRAQEVKHAPSRAFYSGSPLAYSFSEAGQAKAVYIIDVMPGGPAQVSAVHLTSGVPLERWRCMGGIDEALARLEDLGGRPLWLDLEVHSSRFLTLEETARLRQSHSGLITIRCVVQGAEIQEQPVSLASLSVSELFVRYYKHRKGGIEPTPELVQLFTKLANMAATGEETGVIN
ncbi:MAG: exonuclease SbcD [Bacillota bacterium]|nr:MAG: exonuclease SbcD [Bacillota bacterium]MBS3950201.1 exonuclease SbcCD subunit D [Peptococcaceae bacterium]